jgi:hypothetical protein
MANLAHTLCRTYTLNAAGDYTPTDTLDFKLQVRKSKYEGRPEYLQLRHYGNARPQFISSLYEPRTPQGMYNVEIERKRYELIKTDTGVRIEPLPYRTRRRKVL